MRRTALAARPGQFPENFRNGHRVQIPCCSLIDRHVRETGGSKDKARGTDATRRRATSTHPPTHLPTERARTRRAATIRAEEDKTESQQAKQQSEREALEIARQDLLRLQNELEVKLDKVNEDLARVDTKLEALKRS